MDILGQIYSIKIDEETKNLTLPQKIQLKAKAKLISIGMGISFAVTETNKILYWEGANPDRIFQVKGVHNEIIDIKSGSS